MSEFHAEAPQATAREGLAQGPYVADRAGFEHATLRTKGTESISEPPRPLSYDGDNDDDNNNVAADDYEDNDNDDDDYDRDDAGSK